jgi:antirestriction protein ArdC
MNMTQSSISTQVSSKELIAKIDKHIHDLAIATDAARVSEEMIRYLDACAKFHHYSLFNVWLIIMTKPNASAVAGFRKWQSLNRYVRKGEHGIPILAPLLAKKKDDATAQKEVVGFKVVYVFDVSQTEGEPLPRPPDWKSPEKNKELTERLIQYANSLGISVIEKELHGEVQGVSKGGEIELSINAGTATLIHEIAHELMHQTDGASYSTKIREMEAEAVAYVVARYFGIDHRQCPNYSALHGVESTMILDHMERIRKTAIAILHGMDGESIMQNIFI